jgi:Carboxypeptidase regulatory-like domain
MKQLLSFVVVTALFAACSPSPTRPTHVIRDPAPTEQAANTFGLSGSVSESTADGVRPVEGATIGVADEFGNFMSTSSQADGRYEVHGLSAGTWELSVSKDGYDTMTMTVQLSGEMALDIELRTSSNHF